MWEQNVEVVRRVWDAWQRRDLAAIEAELDPEIVWDTSHFRDWPESNYSGIEGFLSALREGKIVRVVNYENRAEASRAAGVGDGP